MENKKSIAPLDFVRAKGKYPDSFKIHIVKDETNQYTKICSEIEKGKPYPCEYVGLVTEINSSGECSIEWLGDGNKHLHNAWWEQEKLEKIDSLPHLLARNMAHPFGNNKKEVDKYYNKNDNLN